MLSRLFQNVEVTRITWVSAPFSSFKPAVSASNLSLYLTGLHHRFSSSDSDIPVFLLLRNIRTPANTLAHRIAAVVQSCLTLCDPMDFSTSGFPVLPHLLEFAQTHVH